MNKLSPAVKDRLILLGWIAGLLLAASLVWSLSFNYRAAVMAVSVNKALEAAGDKRTVTARLPGRFAVPANRGPVFTGPLNYVPARTGPTGLWYGLEDSDSLFFVFVIMNEGILVPCGVEIGEDGKAAGLIPLGGHARQVIGRIPDGVIRVYLNRVEAAAAHTLRDAERRER